eukprot:11169602-Lingulodinium_polyedra.AAC.1
MAPSRCRAPQEEFAAAGPAFFALCAPGPTTPSFTPPAPSPGGAQLKGGFVFAAGELYEDVQRRGGVPTGRRGRKRSAPAVQGRASPSDTRRSD